MTDPYWSGDGISLYLGDCREVTEWLDADVLVTDPPYGRAWRQGDTGKGRGWASDSHDGIANDNDTEIRDQALEAWVRANPQRLPGLVFGDPLIPQPVDARLALIYSKGISAGFTGAIGGYRRDAEIIYLIGQGWGSSLGGRSSIISTRSSAGGNLARTTGHPHTKPLDVMEQLILHAPPGTIADPFAGSGSTLVAAKLQGRKAIGVELWEPYAEIAARRLDQGVLDFGDAS